MTLSLRNEIDVPARAKQHAFDELFRIHRAVGPKRHKGVGGPRLSRGNSGNVVGQDIEPPDLDHPIQHLQPLGQRSLHRIAGFARMLDDRRCGVALDRPRQRQNVEIQPDGHASLELAGYISDSCQANFVGRAAIQPHHDIPDHSLSPGSRQPSRCLADRG
ncbi:hypothetical protein [Bradyrhizobium sp. RT3a]|uniref:hypothetical protein n=1 Tax=Bradyrhizobium sp. RT3a TaxID=3156333 RepID=UPI0033969330